MIVKMLRSGPAGADGARAGNRPSQGWAGRWIVVFLLAGLMLARAGDDSEKAWELGPFLRPPEANPIIKPDPALVFDCPMRGRPVHWAALHTFNPGAVLKNGRVCLVYRAEDDSGPMSIGGHTSRIGLAESDDGAHFTCRSIPVLYPDQDDQQTNEWTGGCEDPRVVEAEDGTFVMTYTEFRRDKKGRLARLAVATSPDLTNWTKHGPIFGRVGGDMACRYCKSGAILTAMVNGRLVAVKHLGKYWMYWGEGEIRVASSDNLIDWIPGPAALRARAGKFDSGLVEAGPPAVLLPQGIVLIYNAKNAAAGEYAGGQALFDGEHPDRLLDRTEVPFFKPETALEKTGQYQAGTTFLEGLVFFDGRWLLYYGCADSFSALACTAR